MAVNNRGNTVSCPTCVGDGDLGDEGLGGVDVGLCDALAEARDLADLFEEDGLALFVAVDADARRVVAAVLLAGEAVDEDLADLLAVLQRGERLCCNIYECRPFRRDSCSRRRFRTL